MIILAALANLAMWAGAVAAIDSAGEAAVITGIFALINTALQTLILRQARRNAELTRETRTEVIGVRETAREGVQELHDVKRKVRGERRNGKDRRPPKRGGGRRKGDPGDP